MKKVFAVGVALALLFGALSALLTILSSRDDTVQTVNASNGGTSSQSSSVQGSMFNRIKNGVCSEYEVPNAAALAAFYETQPDMFTRDLEWGDCMWGVSQIWVPYEETYAHISTYGLQNSFIPRNDLLDEVDGVTYSCIDGIGYLVETTIGGDVSLKEQEGLVGTIDGNVISISVEALTCRTFNSVRGRVGKFVPTASVNWKYVAIYKLNGENTPYIFTDDSPLELTAISHYRDETYSVVFDGCTGFNYSTDEGVWDLHLSWNDDYSKCAPVETVAIYIYGFDANSIYTGTEYEGYDEAYNWRIYPPTVGTDYQYEIYMDWDNQCFRCIPDKDAYAMCEDEAPYDLIPGGYVFDTFYDLVGYVNDAREIVWLRDS